MTPEEQSKPQIEQAVEPGTAPPPQQPKIISSETWTRAVMLRSYLVAMRKNWSDAYSFLEQQRDNCRKLRELLRESGSGIPDEFSEELRKALKVVKAQWMVLFEIEKIVERQEFYLQHLLFKGYEIEGGGRLDPQGRDDWWAGFID